MMKLINPSRKDSMTASENNTAPSSALRSAEHDRQLHQARATVSAITHPTPSIVRVTARLDTSADDPAWALPNVAFRIHLGSEHGDASRIYTVRSFDAANAEFCFDIVRHAHASPMMRWSAALRVGSAFELTGPRPQLNLDSAHRRIVLLADDTGMPALHAMLSAWPAGAGGIGWIVTDDEQAFAELPQVAGLQLQRLVSSHVAPDGALAAQARSLQRPSEYLVWGAGERDEMRAIRQYLRKEAGLAADQVRVAGYWKRGVSNTEIDLRRRQSYEQLIARGGTLADFDDLAVDV